MKRCPICNRTYADELLNFCLEDGTLLVHDAGGRFDAQATLVAPAFDTSPQRPVNTTPAYARQPAPGWSQPPAPQYAVPQQQKRSRLPWILGGGLLLLLVGAGLAGIAALVFSSSGSDRERANQNVARTVVSNTKSTNTSQTDSNGNSYANTNSSDEAGVDYSDRVGRYTGKAINTTSDPDATGDAVIEITEINNSTGAVRVKMDYSNGLCGRSNSSGVINRSTGEMRLTGPLTPGGSGCPNVTWSMTTRCTFSGTDTLKCTYRLTNSDYLPQAGKFEVSRQ